MTFKNTSGVYRITNTENGKRYYGSSKYLRQRWNRHKHMMRMGTHGNPGIKEDAAIYGEEAFEFTVLCYCKPEDRKRLEGALIDQNLGEGCYNLKDGNDRLAEETKAKMSASHMGKTHSDETIAKMSAAHMGKTRSDETKAKISASHMGKPSHRKGKTLSEQHKANLRKPKRKVTCPHCGKVGGGGAMKRHHFDRCSYKP